MCNNSVTLNGDFEQWSVDQRIELFNLMGQKVREMHKHASERLLVLDRRQLPSGIYVLKVSNSNKQYTQKLLFK